MLKSTFKILIIFLLSFISFFYNNYDLNVLIALPLFTFAMFSGIKYMLFSIIGIASGSFVYYIFFNSYNCISFFLVSATIYIILFFVASLISLLFNKTNYKLFFSQSNKHMLNVFYIFLCKSNTFK